MSYLPVDRNVPGVYCEERREVSKLNSIPASLYFSMTTLVTLGYGDSVPVSHCLYIGANESGEEHVRCIKNGIRYTGF